MKIVGKPIPRTDKQPVGPLRSLFIQCRNPDINWEQMKQINFNWPTGMCLLKLMDIIQEN